jgi:hypothetical protein
MDVGMFDGATMVAIATIVALAQAPEFTLLFAFYS